VVEKTDKQDSLTENN